MKKKRRKRRTRSDRVTTETNVDLTKEYRDKDKTDKCIFFSLFNSGSVNCGEFVEFEESDGCLYENTNYKYQYKKQTSENKIEYVDSEKSFETKHKILERGFESK